MSTQQTLSELLARLPELQWKLSQLTTSLPKGTFRCQKEGHRQDFVNEIQSDLQVLSSNLDGLTGAFIAGQIQKKIDILVATCRLSVKPAKTVNALESSILSQIATRNQRLQHLEKELSVLNLQLKALESRLSATINPLMLLNLQGEKGAIERQLTLIQEAYQKVSGD